MKLTHEEEQQLVDEFLQQHAPPPLMKPYYITIEKAAVEWGGLHYDTTRDRLEKMVRDGKLYKFRVRLEKGSGSGRTVAYLPVGLDK